MTIGDKVWIREIRKRSTGTEDRFVSGARFLADAGKEIVVVFDNGTTFFFQKSNVHSSQVEAEGAWSK